MIRGDDFQSDAVTASAEADTGIESKAEISGTARADEGSQRRLVRRLLPFVERWEFLLICLIVVTSIVSAATTPYFLSPSNFWTIWSVSMPVGIMMFPMVFVILIAGIDLSVASIMAMAGVSTGLLYQSGMNIWLAAVLGVLVGTVGGLINGIAVVGVGLPPLIVTLATQALYRGVAVGLIGVGSISNFPSSFTFIGQATIFGSSVPVSIGMFVVLAIVFGLVLRRTTAGRKLYAIGNNPIAARFSALSVRKVTVAVFTLSGLFAGVAGLLITAQENSIRSDTGLGLELNVITAALLGGVSVFGGRGNILGPVLALFLIGEVQYAMDLHNVPTQLLQVAVGVLLIGSVFISEMMRKKRVRALSSGMYLALRQSIQNPPWRSRMEP